MTTNEREAFEKWFKDRYPEHAYLLDRKIDGSYIHAFSDIRLEAWQARAAIEQRQEVTDEMVNHAAKAYCEAIKSSGPHEHQLQGIRAVLQSIAQPVRVPDGWRLVPIRITTAMAREFGTVEICGIGGFRRQAKLTDWWEMACKAAPEYKP